FEKSGYAGLAAGIEAYRELVKKYWEACFPKVKPPHGRLNAVQYLGDKILPSVELKGGQAKRNPEPGEKATVHQCAALMEEFVKTVDAAFTGLPESPNLAPLNRALRALKEKV